MNLGIRRLVRADAGAYRRLRLHMLQDAPKAFGDSVAEAQELPQSRWIEHMESDRAYFGAFADDELVGSANFVAERPAKMAHRGWIYGVYMKPEMRGTGLALKMINHVLEHARCEVLQVHLGVGAYNEGAQKLYRRAGFEIYGTEPRSLRVDGKYLDEHLMVCFLDEEMEEK